MRTTIDDIQNHLDGMYLGKTASGSTNIPGILPPAIENERALDDSNIVTEPTPAAHGQNSETLLDDNTSFQSRSIRDDASSVLSKDVEDDDRSAQGQAMASYAKQNLARNVQLAQEHQEKQRVAEERAREAERERLRLDAPPVEGLLLSDESDNEDNAVDGDDNDDDDNSIFPSKRNDSEKPSDYQYTTISQSLAQGGTETSLAKDTQRSHTADLPAGAALPDRSETEEHLNIGEVSSMVPSATTGQRQLFESDRLNYSPLEQTSSSVSSLYRPTPEATPAIEKQEMQPELRPSIAETISRPRDATPPINIATPKPPPAATLQTEQFNPQVGMAERDNVPNPYFTYKSSQGGSQPFYGETNPIASVAQPSQRNSGLRRSIDAGTAPGQEGLMTLVEQVTTRAATPSSTAQPSSPYQSTIASSRHSSGLGTAFTPSTTATNDNSPRSGNFPRQKMMSDPRDWTIDQVVEWGQSKGFDENILSKFRGKVWRVREYCLPAEP